jgi:hypothetical protein
VFAGWKTIQHLIENTSTGLDPWRNCVPCVVERFSMNPLVPMFLDSGLQIEPRLSRSDERRRIVDFLSGDHAKPARGERLAKLSGVV